MNDDQDTGAQGYAAAVLEGVQPRRATTSAACADVRTTEVGLTPGFAGAGNDSRPFAIDDASAAWLSSAVRPAGHLLAGFIAALEPISQLDLAQLARIGGTIALEFRPLPVPTFSITAVAADQVTRLLLAEIPMKASGAGVH